MIIPSLLAAAILAAGSSADQPSTSITIYSSADPAGFDPTRYVAQQRNGFTPRSSIPRPSGSPISPIRERASSSNRSSSTS